jgi:hypothetical protein
MTRAGGNEMENMDETTEVERGGQVATDAQQSPLIDDADGFRRRWESIQSGFVDEPRQSMQQADTLVDEVIQSLTDAFARERQGLEHQWSSGEDVSTEDLRRGLQRYRSFFNRLLSR